MPRESTLFDVIKGPAVLYYGAGWDMDPIGPECFRAYKYFLFVDALPNKVHYEPTMHGYKYCKDEDTYVATLNRKAAKKGFALIEHIKNTLHYSNGIRHLIFLYNTTVNKSLVKKSFRRAAKHVKELYVAGYYPWKSGLTSIKYRNLVSPDAESLEDVKDVFRMENRMTKPKYDSEFESSDEEEEREIKL